MTFDARYELNGSVFRFENLPNEALLSIKRTRSLIVGCTDAGLITQSVTSLNEELVGLGLIGKESKLASDDAIVTEQSVDPNDRTLTPVFDSDILTSDTFDGTFLGCSATELGNGPDLVYVVEMPLDEDTLRYRTAIAPVDSARIQVESSPQFMNRQDGDDLAAYLMELSTIRDPEFQDDLKDLIQLFEDYPEIDTAFMRALGEVTSHMLANPFIGMDEQARTNVGYVIDSCFDKTIRYRIEGDTLEVTKVASGSELKVTTVIMDGYYNGVGASMDYGKVHDSEGSGIVPLESLQPVLMIKDLNGEEHRVPLKYIRECENVTPLTCREFNTQFTEKKGDASS